MLDSDTTDLNWRRIPVNRIITVDVLWYILALSLRGMTPKQSKMYILQ